MTYLERFVLSSTKTTEFLKKGIFTYRYLLNECLLHSLQEHLPKIAVLGSGGSERAMVALLGSLVALFQDDLLDCVLYLAGLSGSTW